MKTTNQRRVRGVVVNKLRASVASISMVFARFPGVSLQAKSLVIFDKNVQRLLLFAA